MAVFFLCAVAAHKIGLFVFLFLMEKLPRLLTTHGKLIFWLCQRVHAQARSSDHRVRNIFPFSRSHSQNVYVHKMKMSVHHRLWQRYNLQWFIHSSWNGHFHCAGDESHRSFYTHSRNCCCCCCLYATFFSLSFKCNESTLLFALWILFSFLAQVI